MYRDIVALEPGSAEFCQAVRTNPRVVKRLSPNDQDLAIECFAEFDDVAGLDHLKADGIIRQDNAFEVLERLTETGSSPPVLGWFMGNFRFEPIDLASIPGQLRDPNFAGVVAMAKLFPLNREAHQYLLEHMLDAAVNELRGINEKVPNLDLSRIYIDPRRYPMLAAYRKEIYPRGGAAPDTRLPDADLAKYEHILRRVGWYLWSYAGKYGEDVLKDYLENLGHGPEDTSAELQRELGGRPPVTDLYLAPFALLRAYRRVIRGVRGSRSHV